MKKLVLLSAFSFVLLSSCNNAAPVEEKIEQAVSKDVLEYFGDTITQEGAIPANEVLAKLIGKDSLKIKIEGKIEEVCQKKGCWMNVKVGEEQSMRIRFKDYGFFVPKDASGKTAVFDGIAYNDTIPVNELKHYAEDEGKSKEEIEKITKPEISVSFEARGVIIKK
jgi:hypothetical protein